MKEKVVLVTGASRGIGKAIAKKFGEEGYTVAVNYNKSKKDAEKVVEEIISKGGKAKAFCYDVADFENAENFVNEIEKNLGKIDVLINNAGIAIDKPFEEKTYKDWQKTLDVNLIAPFVLTNIIAKKMYDKKNGIIINIASTSAYENNPFSVDYDSSKAGLVALTKNTAIQFQPYIRVNSISPGWIDTEMNLGLDKDFLKNVKEEIFVRRLGKSEEVAELAYFLASDKAKFINGEDFVINGGNVFSK